MHINNTTKGKHMTKSERQLIGIWKNQEKLSNREIAKRLGKAPQTIHNEIKRGWIDLAYSGGKTEYSWQVAQAESVSQKITKTNINLNQLLLIMILNLYDWIKQVTVPFILNILVPLMNEEQTRM